MTVEGAIGPRRWDRRARDAAEIDDRPAAGRTAGGARGRGTLVALAVGMALIVGTSAFAAVQVAGRARPMVEAMLPPETVVVSPDVFAEVAAPPPTAAPPPELAALRGRPPSPVDGDEAVCAGPLKAGRLRPQTPAQWSGTSAPASVPFNDADARAEIAQMMRRRFRLDEPEQAVREAIQLYESPRLREVVGEEIVLRAALAELKGTLGEPVLRFLLTTDRPVRIRFGTPSHPGANAEALSYGHEIGIVVRNELRFESAAVLAPVVMHELLHQNGQSQQPEEVINNILDIRVMLELMRDAPAVFARRTEAVDHARFGALAQLNTRVGSVLAVHRSDTDSVLPGFEGPPVPPIGMWIKQDGFREGTTPPMYSVLADAPTKGHPTLVEILRLVAPDADVSDRALFDQAAVDLLDTNAGIGLCDQLVAAEVLGVVPKGSPGQRFAREYLSNLTK